MDLTHSITIYEHDPAWKDEFLSLIPWLEYLMGEQMVAYHHVGTTALAHSAGRSSIDILVEVINIRQLNLLLPRFEEQRLLEGTHAGEVGYRFFYTVPPQRSVHLHVREAGDPQIERLQAIHRYLSSQPKVCRLYSRFKFRLMLESLGDPLKYARSKERFLQQVRIQSTRCWTRPAHPPRGKAQELDAAALCEQVWDSYCLYLLSLMSYCPYAHAIPHPSAALWHITWEPPIKSHYLLWRAIEDPHPLEGLESLLKAEVERGCNLTLLLPSTSSNLLSKNLVFTHSLHFHTIPLEGVKTYVDSIYRFERIHEGSNMGLWSGLQKSYNSWVPSVSASLPSTLYSYGQPIEFYLIYYHQTLLGGFACHLYKGSLGVVELYAPKELLKAISNFVFQRAQILHYHYCFFTLPQAQSPPGLPPALLTLSAFTTP